MSICPLMSGVDLDGALVRVECLKHDCAKYINVQGHSPQSGEAINQWDCADAWVPLLLIENSQQQRQTGAAVESFRNEMIKDNRLALAGMSAEPHIKRIGD